MGALLLARGLYWQLTLDSGRVDIALLREVASEGLADLAVSVPLGRWNRVVKQVRSDRKLLAGILLDFARNKEQVAPVIAQDRLYGELQQAVMGATLALVECGALALAPVDVGMD